MQLTLFSPEHESLTMARQRFLDAILAPQTKCGYRYDWAAFERWCSEHQRSALPARSETVSLYLTDMLSRCKVSTARRSYYAIVHRHKDRGLPWNGFPILQLLEGAQRLRLEKPRRMRPITIPQLKEIAAALRKDGSVRSMRDRAVMLAGFTSALRSVSLSQLTTDDVEFSGQGVILTIPREKQDQEGRGRMIGIPKGKHDDTCTLAALRDWLDVRPRVKTSRLFLALYLGRRPPKPTAPKGICRIVKECVRRIGLDPQFYGGHSLRAGLITAAGEENISDLLIAAHTGHRSAEMIRVYLRKTGLFRANVCAALDL